MTTQSKVSFKPLGNRIVVEPDEDEAQMSSGGIYIPDTAKEKPQEGTVVAVDGTSIAVSAASLCLHGDSPGSVAAARAVRAALDAASISVRAPW